MDPNFSFGEAIKHSRLKRGIDIKEASWRAGLFPFYWKWLEEGKVKLRLVAFAKMAKGLETTPYQLMREIEYRAALAPPAAED